MYAIVEIAGQQFKVERGNKLYVHRLEAKEGANVEFDRVLLLDNAGKISVGSPLVEGARVAATIVGHLKGDKVAVFKKKRRKGFQKWNNHRQSFTQVIIQGVLAKGEKLKEEPLTATLTKRLAGVRKPEAAETAEVKAEAAPAPEAPAKKAAKKAAPKKAAAKKKKSNEE